MIDTEDSDQETIDQEHDRIYAKVYAFAVKYGVGDLDMLDVTRLISRGLGVDR